MTREEAIRELKIFNGTTRIRLSANFWEALNIAIKALEQEPTWIPVSKRLPKSGEYVGDVAKYYLVQNEFGDMMVARYTHNEYWEQIYQLKPISDEMVAWMPLPQAYKAESEDKE